MQLQVNNIMKKLFKTVTHTWQRYILNWFDLRLAKCLDSWKRNRHFTDRCEIWKLITGISTPSLRCSSLNNNQIILLKGMKILQTTLSFGKIKTTKKTTSSTTLWIHDYHRNIWPRDQTVHMLKCSLIEISTGTINLSRAIPNLITKEIMLRWQKLYASKFTIIYFSTDLLLKDLLEVTAELSSERLALTEYHTPVMPCRTLRTAP